MQQLPGEAAAIIEAARGALWLLDSAGTVYYVSSTAAAFVELEPAAMLGRPWPEVVAAAGMGCGDWVPAHLPPSRWALPLYGQTTVAPPSGTLRHVQVALTELARDEGPSHVVVGMGDITRLVGTLEALRAGEERYRALVETMGDGIAIVDGSLCLTFVNGAFARMLGHEPAELPGRSVLSLCDETGAVTTAENTERVMSLRTEAEYELNYLTRTGEAVPVLVKATALPDASGEVTAVLAVVRNISGRKRAERRLAESELLFRSVFSESPVAILLYDRDARLTTANDAALRLAGKGSVEQLRGTCLFEHPAMTEEIRRRLLNGETVRRDITVNPRLRDSEGWLCRDRKEPLVAEVVLAPLRLKDQATVSGYIVQAQDITRRRKDEEAQRMATVGQLASGVAHEFNNLLASMMMRAEFALETEDPDEFRRLAESVVRAGARGADICSGLATFARPAECSATPLCLDDVIREALERSDAEVRHLGVSVERSLNTAGHTIAGDAAQLALAFCHLIGNACHAMRQGGVLSVLTEAGTGPDGSAQLVARLKDTGEGIAPEHLPLVFEPFFTTKGRLGESDLPGTGLGLSVVHGIVKGHAGAITISSEPGAGTIVELRFPTSEVPRPPRGAPEEPGAPAYRVLVVEDDVDLGDAIAESLRRRGHHAVVAYTPRQAADALTGGGFDLIISDLAMPGGGGPEVVAAARALDRPPPVLMITGKTETTAAEMMEDITVERLMFKPFTIAQLLEACYELVEETGE